MFIINLCELIIINDKNFSEEKIISEFLDIILTYAKHDFSVIYQYHDLDFKNRKYENDDEIESYINFYKNEKYPEELKPQVEELLKMILNENDSISGSFNNIDNFSDKINYYYYVKKIKALDNLWGFVLIISSNQNILFGDELYLLNEIMKFFQIALQNNQMKLLKIKAENARPRKKEEVHIYLKSIGDGVIKVNNKGII